MKRHMMLFYTILMVMILSACSIIKPAVHVDTKPNTEIQIQSSDSEYEEKPSENAQQQGKTALVEEFPQETQALPTVPTPQLDPELTDPPTLREIEPADSELVCVTDYIPEIIIELRYATSNNFTGQIIYDFSDAWLRYGTVKKLMTVQTMLKENGYCLKIWDAYRPSAAQFKLWEVVPDATYVANPYSGHSNHSNGGTVDLTMVRQDGLPLEMPTDFDDFSSQADRDYSDISDEARAHAELLEQVMETSGFKGYSGEWWHFSDNDSYPYEDLQQLQFPLNRQALYEPDCEEYISLRTTPDYEAEVLAHVPRDTVFCVLGWNKDFARIEFQGQEGYVSMDYIQLQIP